MRGREQTELTKLELEKIELDLPFSFEAPGESIAIFDLSGKPACYLQDETFYAYGTGQPLFYLAINGVHICRYGDGAAVYLAHENYLYAFADPSWPRTRVVF